MSIRVIAGSAKGRQLKLVPGDSTRPIMDRVKESLFNIIGRGILDAAFCDLYAGTGSVGIEALSRGAKQATFIDLESRAIDTIRANLRLTKLEEKAIVRRADALALLAQPQAAAFDIIYIAPPQYKGLWVKTLELLQDAQGWFHAESSIIVQIDPTERQEMILSRFTLADERQYGSTLLLFYAVKE
jgi:16S rRNA (guanine(966)-N(2))-methyltransferase RsmD